MDILLTTLLLLCWLALLGILYLAYNTLAALRKLQVDFRESQKNLTSILLRTNSEILAALRDLELKDIEKSIPTFDRR